MLFEGFAKSLYPVQKFHSDTERRFAVVLENDRDVLKWFKPSKGDFQLYYTAEDAYEPDFVAETKTARYLCEPKAEGEMTDEVVRAKAEATRLWCEQATKLGGKPWQYLLIPHTAVDESKTLAGLSAAFGGE
jgi:type III restriction enzyme